MGVIFQGGRFGLAETVASTPLLQIMLAATPLWILYMVLVRAFYADGDTLTPATTGTVMTLLALPVYYWWAVPLGAWAIALTSAVSVSAYVLWLVAIWARRQGTAPLRACFPCPAGPCRAPCPPVRPPGRPVRAGRPACLRDAGLARRGPCLSGLRCQRSGLCRDLPALELQAGTRHTGACLAAAAARPSAGTGLGKTAGTAGRPRPGLGRRSVADQKAVPRTRRCEPCPEPCGRRKAFPSSSRRRRCQKILLTGLLILLLAVPAPAAEKEVAGVFFPLPEGWSVVEENTSGTTSTLLLRQEGRRTAIAVMVAADAGLAPARIAAELASVTGATADPVEREGQYSFPIRKDGQDGVCFLAQSNGRFILVSVLGELPPAVPLLEGMRCRPIPALCCADLSLP